MSSSRPANTRPVQPVFILPRLTLQQTAKGTSIILCNFGPSTKSYLRLQGLKLSVVYHTWVLTNGDRQYRSPSFWIFTPTIRSKGAKVGRDIITHVFCNLSEIWVVSHTSRRYQTANRHYTAQGTDDCSSHWAQCSTRTTSYLPTQHQQTNIR